MMVSRAKLSFEFEAVWPYIQAQAKVLGQDANKTMCAIAYGAGFFQGRAETNHNLDRAVRLLSRWNREAGRAHKRKAAETEELLNQTSYKRGTV